MIQCILTTRAGLLEIVREKERTGDKGSIAEAKRRAQSAQMQKERPCGQNDQAADKMTRQRDNLALSVDKMTRPCGQNDQTLKESFLIPENPLNPSSESLTLFSEKTVCPWAQLTETEQQPYRERAEQELIALFGFAEWKNKLGATAKERQIASRAASLYQKGSSQ